MKVSYNRVAHTPPIQYFGLPFRVFGVHPPTRLEPPRGQG